MGIYDREYYRREGPSFLASFTEGGRVCYGLIIVNVAVFIIQMLTYHTARSAYVEVDGIYEPVARSYGAFTEFFDLAPERVLHGEVWRLLTYGFLHDPNTYMHILFNMLFLWWFGSDIETLYGPREFLAIYLLSVVLGGVAYTLAAAADIPGMSGRCLGASGAVTTVMVLCALHFPTRMILIFFLIPVPLWLLVLFQVVHDLFGFLSFNPKGVAVTVHLAGAAFGYAYFKGHWRITDLWTTVQSWQKVRRRPKLRVYHEEEPQPLPVGAPATAAADVDEHLEAKMDAVLEKVARSGKASLTEGELAVLMKASEVLKKKRT